MKKIRNYIIVTLMLLLLFSTNAYMQGDIAVSGPTVTLSSLNGKEASTIKTTCEDIMLSCKLDAPAPCRLDAPDFSFVC